MSSKVEDKVKEKKELAILAGEVLYHYKLIARNIGYSEDQLRNWRDEDEDFSVRLNQSRSRFIEKNMRKSKPEFLLERMEPELFAPPKPDKESVTLNAIQIILNKYGGGEILELPTTETRPSQDPA